MIIIVVIIITSLLLYIIQDKIIEYYYAQPSSQLILDASKTSDKDIANHLYNTVETVFNKMKKDYPYQYPQINIKIDDNFVPPKNSPSALAYATKNNIVINGSYMKKHPTSLNVITHEMFHIIQSAGGKLNRHAPAWITEGTADWARDKYKVDINEVWSLDNAKPTPKKSYKDGYATTARFLKWIDTKHPNTISKLIHSIYRTNQVYNDSFWLTNTKQSIDQLWNTYTNS